MNNDNSEGIFSIIFGVLTLKDDYYHKALKYIDFKIAIIIFSFNIIVSLLSLISGFKVNLLIYLLLGVLGFPFFSLLELGLIYVYSSLITVKAPDRKERIKIKFKQLFILFSISSIPFIFDSVFSYVWIWVLACKAKSVMAVSDIKKMTFLRALGVVWIGGFLFNYLFWGIAMLIMVGAYFIKGDNSVKSIIFLVFFFMIYPILYAVYRNMKDTNQIIGPIIPGPVYPETKFDKKTIKPLIILIAVMTIPVIIILVLQYLTGNM